MDNTIKIQQRIDTFVKLGKKLTETNLTSKNQWFTPENIKFAVNQISNLLNETDLYNWTEKYQLNPKNPKKIGVISAGNIPLVGFHDFLSVIISGNIFVGKFSSKDEELMPQIINLITDIEPKLKNYIDIKTQKISDFDAVIATGSNNSARYFEYYFGKYPHIIRKNRNSAAIITGTETETEMQLLADDIFIYFGLGCRNVSKLFLPDNYNLDTIFKNLLKYSYVRNHNKYANNYDYNRALYLMNKIKFFDNGFAIIKEDIGISSPVSVIYYENYSNINTVKQRISADSEKIQCVAAKNNVIENSVYFGQTQKPALFDYADNIDTLKFLTDLQNAK